MAVVEIVAGILEVDRLSDKMAQNLEGKYFGTLSHGTSAQLMLRWPHNVG